MKKALIMLLCLLAALCLAVPALGEGVSRTVSVSGSSNISLAADTATLRIGVSTVRDTVAEAQSENNEIMQRVIAAILGQNVAQEDVVTSDFSVYTERDYSDASVPVRYHVDNTLYVTVRALDTVGDVIDAATAAGANQMYGLTFSSSGETAAYEKALRRYTVGNRYVGTVSMVDMNGVFVSLDGGIDCLCSYPKRGRPPRGSRVTVRILGINNESNRIWGAITHIATPR